MSPRDLRVRLIAGLALPIIAFVVLLEIIGNATGALAITDGIPVLWALAFAIWRRRIEPITLIPVAVFTLALVLTIAFGGSPLPLELRRSWFPGTVGLACLISLAVHRPLLVLAAAKLSAAHPEQAGNGGLGLEAPERRRLLTVLTAIVGVTGTADAAAQIALALTVSTATFGVVARIASYAIIASGLAVGALYVRWIRGRAHGGRPRPES
ncbi:MAG TPA: VC0807 family protein [Solirubrobacteraceae bacterium]|nr:VC0807 family protein [Solirubrobacteraceae bacterium]